MKQFEKRLANKGSQIRACRKFFQIVEKPKTDLEILAQKSMLENMSYQLPESAKHDRLIGLKELWRSFKDSTDEKWAPTSTPRLILDGRNDKEILRKEYTQSIYKKEFSFVSRDALRSNQGNVSNPIKVWVLLKGLKDGVKVFFFEENRVNIALKHRSIRELLSLISLLERNGVEEVHDFNQYEIDSNVYYLVVKEVFGGALKIYKYPSPGPLYLHNSILLTDTIALNHGYHAEEIKQLPDIKYNELKMVPPEGYYQYAASYKDTHRSPEVDVGFYSHAGWIRMSEGHADDGLGIADLEIELLEKLRHVITHNGSSISLKIFLHPREKEVFDESIVHYKAIFGDEVSIEFSNVDEPSTKAFDQVRIGIGVYSTILFERLVLGRPTLIYGGTDRFPIRGSKLNNIFCDQDNLADQLLNGLELDQTSFFASNEIEYMRLPNA